MRFQAGEHNRREASGVFINRLLGNADELLRLCGATLCKSNPESGLPAVGNPKRPPKKEAEQRKKEMKRKSVERADDDDDVRSRGHTFILHYSYTRRAIGVAILISKSRRQNVLPGSAPAWAEGQQSNSSTLGDTTVIRASILFKIGVLLNC